jgi:hypothetical protein
MPTAAGARLSLRWVTVIMVSAAKAARAQTLAESRERCAGRTWTVARWLRYWLTTRRSIRATTLHSYTVHVEKATSAIASTPVAGSAGIRMGISPRCASN